MRDYFWFSVFDARTDLGYADEILVYDRILTWDEMRLVHDYLATKWGFDGPR